MKKRPKKPKKHHRAIETLPINSAGFVREVAKHDDSRQRAAFDRATREARSRSFFAPRSGGRGR